MPSPETLLAFALVALGLVLTPGPNMAYLVSRTLCQGRLAGLVSLGGVALGFCVYLGLAAFGITAMLMAVPYAYDALRLTGALYLGWLAWQALRPGGHTPFATRDLPAESPRRLFAMGFLTNLLNPKAAVLYLSLLPQFIHPARGDVLTQALALGLTQIAVSLSVNAAIIGAASQVPRLLGRHPSWVRAQRWLLGTVLGALALRLAVEGRRQA